MEAPQEANPQLQALLARHRENRAGFLERDIPFSWWRLITSLISYGLLLSDVLRSGLGIKRNVLPQIEPSQSVFFGPYAYAVLHALQNDTTGTHSVWPYKFDTTSVATRSYAEFLHLHTWPSCLLYKKVCDQSTMKVSTVFKMLNSLVDAMAARNSRGKPVSNLTLRIKNAWFDRVHHYILPQVFGDHMVRTSQALYFDPKVLSRPDFQFCAKDRVRPHSCLRFSTNFAPICVKSNSLCQEIGRIWQHALTRKALLHQQYPGMALDVLVIESQTDHSKAALSFQGRQFLDVVVLTRIRNCTMPTPPAFFFKNKPPKSSLDGHAANCSTIAIDDFRYDVASITTDVTGWYVVVASIRLLGQAYAWVRVLTLFLGCFYARSAEPHYADSGLFVRFIAAARTILLVPSQVVVYGSLFPIGCYVFTHLLDSEVVYDHVSQAFNTALGVFTLNVGKFLEISAVAMRNVWVLAIVLHFVVFNATNKDWSPMDGIPGIPEFSISFVSCLTIMAQFRTIAFRNTRVESISEVMQSSRVAIIRASTYDQSLTLGNSIDFKCLLAAAQVTVVLVLLAWGVLLVLKKTKQIQRVELFFWPKTLVSYAAGTLWPTTALAVSWNGFFVMNERKRRHPSAPMLGPTRIMPMSSFSNLQRGRRLPKRVHLSRALLLHDTEASHFIRRNMEIPDERSREIESMIYLMNLAVMTDPVVLLQLRWFRGKSIGIYESKATQRLFFLPQALESYPNNQIRWDDYSLLRVVNTSELPWLDLLQCG